VDPVTRNSLHVDFFAPNMRVVLSQTIPVVISHVGIHEGVLQTVLSEVMVEALPANLPHQIDADASGLVNIGDTIHAKDLPLPTGVALITDGEELIASLIAEAVEEADETEAEEATEDAASEEAAGDSEEAPEN
ncbi:MAG TPA: hypothetical protein VEW66_09005, partial [Thermomicrobiales bacterium]|nr:hypothetical protein [Thermomicrobiales bacterium]